jgi:hypothetical protein
VHLKKKLSYKLELSLAKRIKFLNKKLGGWDGKKMKVSNNFLPDNNWYNEKIKIIKSLKFDKNKDFIIIPEIFAHFAEELELKKKELNMQFLYKVHFIWVLQKILIKLNFRMRTQILLCPLHHIV